MADILPLHPAEAGTITTESQFGPGDHARLIDREELARRLSLGVSTLDRLRAARKVGPRAIKCGGAIRFLLVEVVAWVSTPTASGELHDAEAWPAVWAAVQKKSGLAGY